MKIHRSQLVGVSEVSATGLLRLDSLFSIFQDMAILHTRQIGIEVNDLLDIGRTWMLNRVAVKIMDLPRFEEHIDVYTWSRSIVRFKGVRDYEILEKGEAIIAASSLWVYVDIKNGRLARVPPEYADRYSVVESRATDVDVEKVDFVDITRPDFILQIATRVSDYDINGHVNNAVMLQYIQTALYRYFDEQKSLGGLDVQFLREIPLTVTDVTVYLEKTTEGCLFEVRNENTVCVKGKLLLM
ncbi:acyl-[acyl-carrier-protein] thioesterase [Desulfopila sp. IMCC35008]|uniref:acyl-[acyl-carrier-protein] thioesterase n=1 Tax=Desulfopila sp. IMCC35008 TaxID=2653858 RepID=UPI0013D68397|nr:acyl-ACP thioesterase domain-containing protein [Desulfopila sp. IMCC35008]